LGPTTAMLAIMHGPIFFLCANVVEHGPP
jgi:hypothetical protein